MTRSSSYTLFLIGSLAWSGAIVLAPLLAGGGSVVYDLFSTICHQLDARAFHLHGHPLPVCIRCSAIYFGFSIGVISFGFRSISARPVSPRWWILAILPMLMDVGLSLSGLHGSSPATRVLSGGCFGVVAGIVITPHFIEGWSQLSSAHPHFKEKVDASNAR